MRQFMLLSVVAVLALPVMACAQDQPQQPPADSAGTPAGQYQPGTLPPEPPVIMPPLPGQADTMAPPPGPDDGQPPMAGQVQPGEADNMAPPPGPGGDDSQPPPPPPPGAAPYSAGGYATGGDATGQHGHDAAMMQRFEARFEAANTTHDGRLTLQQAQDGNMRSIVKHFDQIDTQHLGYVTLNQVMAWRMDQMAQMMERRAAQLRAQQGQ